jgi:pyrroloquinoline quinone (PQQ) biosynthesis protein C
MPASDTLAERVLERVKAAQRAIDRRAGASRPQLERRRRERRADPAPATLEDGGGIESLKQVFYALGVTYRQYRRRTGGPVAPGLRAATDRFRAEPSLSSLVAVAAVLDELDLLN